MDNETRSFASIRAKYENNIIQPTMPVSDPQPIDGEVLHINGFITEKRSFGRTVWMTLQDAASECLQLRIDVDNEDDLEDAFNGSLNDIVIGDSVSASGTAFWNRTELSILVDSLSILGPRREVSAAPNEEPTHSTDNEIPPEMSYTGTNNFILPLGLQTLLVELSEDAAREVRDHFIGLSPTQIQTSLGTYYPVSTANKTIEDVRKEEKAAIEHIAELFKTLTAVGMPPDMAMRVIQEQTGNHPQTVGAMNFPTVNGESLTALETQQMAQLLVQQFGIDGALSIWRRLVDNSATQKELEAKCGDAWLDEYLINQAYSDLPAQSAGLQRLHGSMYNPPYGRGTYTQPYAPPFGVTTAGLQVGNVQLAQRFGHTIL
jgi:hypothetical protein